MNTNLICVDLGNTTIHCGSFVEGKIFAESSLATELVHRQPNELAKLIEGISTPDQGPWGAAYCSVTPKANALLESSLAGCVGEIFQLTSSTCPGLKITHPNPTEIGADRLANAIAVQTYHETPAIVIDLGTATTFDVVGSQSGYLGGVIAPGLAMMTEYLAERTALLPKLDPFLSIPESLVGRSSREAIQLGCSLGFPAMVRGILEKVQTELANREGKEPGVILTGGTARELARALNVNWPVDSSLTLRGLAEAYSRNRNGH